MLDFYVHAIACLYNHSLLVFSLLSMGKLSKLLKIKQLVNNKAKIWIHVCLFFFFTMWFANHTQYPKYYLWSAIFIGLFITPLIKPILEREKNATQQNCNSQLA